MATEQERANSASPQTLAMQNRAMRECIPARLDDRTASPGSVVVTMLSEAVIGFAHWRHGRVDLGGPALFEYDFALPRFIPAASTRRAIADGAPNRDAAATLRQAQQRRSQSL